MKQDELGKKKENGDILKKGGASNSIALWVSKKICLGRGSED